MKHFEVRDPIHGFISFDEKERLIIDHPCFQRLRRIGQLAWTHMVYPGALHTRRSYDILAGEMLKEILSEKKEMTFPGPENSESLDRFLELDDWKIQGMIKDGKGGEPSGRIIERRHYRRVYETIECARRQDLDLFSEIVEKFKDEGGIVDNTKNLLYKFQDKEIPILNNTGRSTIKLSHLSSVVRNLDSVNQYRVYSALLILKLKEIKPRAHEQIVEKMLRFLIGQKKILIDE